MCTPARASIAIGIRAMNQQTWPPVADDEHLLGVSFDGLSVEQALRKVRVTIRGLLVGEIRRCLRQYDEPIGLAALMLSVAAIDILGGFYRGQSASGQNFRDFVGEYMPAYDPRKMYDLRNKILHQYALPEDFVVMYAAQRAAQHLSSAPEFPTKTVLHVPTLADDLDGAAERMLQAAKTDPKLALGIINAAAKSMLMMGQA
jgi:hypothetical protein